MFDFLGIGAQKAGSTWLYTMLSQHKQIDFPLGKECHFWTQSNYYEGLDKYLGAFNSKDCIQGEITPAYAMLPNSTIAFLSENYPKLKIIYTLRNPMDRAWSSALMALKRSEMSFHEASEQWFVDHFFSKGSLLRGDYIATIENWNEHFSKDQFLILFYDDLVDNPTTFLNNVCSFLNIDFYTTQELLAMNPRQKIYSSGTYPMSSFLKEVLWSIYKDKIEVLECHLGMSLHKWKMKIA